MNRNEIAKIKKMNSKELEALVHEIANNMLTKNYSPKNEELLNHATAEYWTKKNRGQ